MLVSCVIVKTKTRSKKSSRVETRTSSRESPAGGAVTRASSAIVRSTMATVCEVVTRRSCFVPGRRLGLRNGADGAGEAGAPGTGGVRRTGRGGRKGSRLRWFRGSGGAARSSRAPVIPPRTARGRPGGARRARRADRDADRRRQEPLLPASRPRLFPTDGRGEPADRAHGGSVPTPGRRRPPGRHGGVGNGRGAKSRRPRAGPRWPRPDRLLLARAVRLDSVPGSAGGARRRPDGDRRGALRLGVGPRLPPRLPAAAQSDRATGAARGDGLHRHGNRGGGGRDRWAARTA